MLQKRTIAPFPQNPIESNGLRARLSYLGAHGVISGTPNGYTLKLPGFEPRHAAVLALPKEDQRDFPVYFSSEEIELAMVITNRTGRTLTGVVLEADQEVFDSSGAVGRRLMPAQKILVAKSMAPGEKVVAHWRTRLVGPADKPVNLEQTHVKISADGATLLDAPQAGVADPPGPGVL